MIRSGSIYATVVAFTAALLPAFVAAAEPDPEGGRFSYGLSAGVTHSDNVARTDTAEESETSGEAGLFASFAYARQRYEASLDADLQYRTHSFGNYSDQLVGGAAANARYRMFRELVTWAVEDNLGQALIESRNTATPDNTQNLNVFSTGPDINIPLGSRTGINLQGRWTAVSYQKSDFGNRRVYGSVGLSRRIGQRATVSLNGSTSHTEFSSLPSSSDYDVRSAYLGWNVEGSRTRLGLNAGYSTLKDQLDSSGGATLSLELTSKVTTRTTMSLHAGRDYGDGSDALRREQGIGGVSVTDRPVAVSSDPQRADYATVSWSAAGSRGGLTLSADWRREDHSRSADLDRRSVGGRLGLTARSASGSRWIFTATTRGRISPVQPSSSTNSARAWVRAGTSARRSASPLDGICSGAVVTARLAPGRATTSRIASRCALDGRLDAEVTTTDSTSGVVNAFSVDVEDYFHVEALSAVVARSSWADREYRAESSTVSSAGVAGSEDVHATFFMLGWVAKRSPPLVRAIHDAGHEVACHGLNHQMVTKQTPAQFRAETRGVQVAAGGCRRRGGVRLPRRHVLHHARIAVGAGHPGGTGIPVRLEHLSDPSRPVRHPGCAALSLQAREPRPDGGAGHHRGSAGPAPALRWRRLFPAVALLAVPQRAATREPG